MFKMITIKRKAEGDEWPFREARKAALFMWGKDHDNFEIRVGGELYSPTEKDRDIKHLTQSLRRLKA